MFALSNFKESFNTGLASANKFRVEFTLPEKLNIIGDQQKLSFLCEIAELPGRSISTAERRTYGPTRKMPYNTIYNDLNTTFICDGKLNVRKIFDDWLDLIIEKDSHNINYLDEYAATIDIIQLDKLENPVRRYSLYDTFPINIDSQALSWSDSDTLLKLNVVFTYRYWRVFDF